MNQHAMHCRSSLRPTISHFKIWGGGRPAPVAAVALPPYFLPTGKGGKGGNGKATIRVHSKHRVEEEERGGGAGGVTSEGRRRKEA